MYIHNGHCLVLQTVNQLIYTLLYNIDNTNTDTEKYSHTKCKYTCSDMQNSLFHCQARFKLDPKVQREAQELHFSRPYPIHTHSVLEYYDMWNAQFSLRMTQQLKTRNDNLACWFFPHQKLLFHTSFHLHE